MRSYAVRRRETTERALAMTDPDRTLTPLWATDPEAALDMAEVANHLPTMERALASGVIGLQLRVATSSTLRQLDPNVLVDALPELPPAVRRVLFRRIRQRRLTTLATALVDVVEDVDEAARLLPLCDSATVERLLPAVEHAVNHATLARYHPEFTLARAADELARLDVTDPWWRSRGYALDEIVAHAPARLLDLVERHAPATWLPFSGRSLALMAEVDAGRLLRLLENRTYQLTRRGYRTLAAANPPELVRLGRQHPVTVLRVLPPSRRAEFFDRLYADKDMTRLHIPDEVLRLLPRDRRAAEARRLRAIAAETGDEDQVRRMTVHLPYDEARDDLTRITRSGEADERVVGYRLLIDCAANGLRLAELLPWLVDRLKREQDPVRAAAVQALAGVHPRALGSATELTQLAADAYDARDFSHSTGAALADVCMKLLAYNGSPVALGVLTDWWKRTRWSYLGDLSRKLRRGQEHDVFEALRTTVEAAADQVDFQPAFALAGAFGRRTDNMPELLDLMWDAIPYGREHASRQAIRHLLADPRHRSARVQRILDLDPTAVFVSEVVDVIQYNRTDLLEVVLGKTIPKGTFAPRKVRLIPLYLGHTERWEPAQRARYAELLMSLADSDKESRGTRAGAVTAIGRIHGPAKRNVLRYLDSDDELIAQAAIARLPDLDEPAEALDLLLTRALGDSRGHAELTSMYTIRRCAARVVPRRLTEVLRAALARGGRVTVRKELVRLVSDFRLPDAVGILRQTWDAPDQHRDVRAAVAFAALSWLDDPTATELLRDAVSGPREISGQLLRTRPYTVPAKHRSSLSALVRQVATGPDDRLRTDALASLDAWARWDPAVHTVLADALTDLTERVSWRAAVQPLQRLVVTPEGAATVIKVMHTLLDAPPTPDAAADRDRPAFQRARAVVNGLTVSWNVQPVFRRAIHRISDELRRYDDIRVENVALRVSTVNPNGPQVLDDLRDLEDLVGDNPFLAVQAGHALARPHDATHLVPAVAQLTNGHLQVALLTDNSHRLGHPEPWRALIRELRRAPDPGVRDAALRLVTAKE
jgi:hypothetical protein